MADAFSEKDPSTVGLAAHNSESATRSLPSVDAHSLHEVVIEKEEIKTGSNQLDNADSDLRLTRSYATDTSAATGVTGLSRTNTTEKPKSWHARFNPLRWRAAPPVPEERGSSQEHSAGFFSLLTFHWMGSLMSVSPTWSPSPES
jgi:hypothetical protein